MWSGRTTNENKVVSTDSPFFFFFSRLLFCAYLLAAALVRTPKCVNDTSYTASACSRLVLWRSRYFAPILIDRANSMRYRLMPTIVLSLQVPGATDKCEESAIDSDARWSWIEWLSSSKLPWLTRAADCLQLRVWQFFEGLDPSQLHILPIWNSRPQLQSLWLSWPRDSNSMCPHPPIRRLSTLNMRMHFIFAVCTVRVKWYAPAHAPVQTDHSPTIRTLGTSTGWSAYGMALWHCDVRIEIESLTWWASTSTWEFQSTIIMHH